MKHKNVRKNARIDEHILDLFFANRLNPAHDARDELPKGAQKLLGILDKVGELSVESFEGFGFTLKDALPLEDRGLVRNLGVYGWAATQQGTEDNKNLKPSEAQTNLEACPYCGESIWLDLVGNEVDWRPCCPDAQHDVEAEGFEAFYGMSVKDALHEEMGFSEDELREAFGAGIPSEEDPDSYYADTTYARFPLVEDVPMWLQKKGKRGKPAFAGPKGWQKSVFKDVERHHSHHKSPQGWKFGVAVNNGRQRVGVAVVSNPVSRVLMQKEPDTLEVTRVCVFGHSKLRRNAVSKLYSLCAKEAKKLGVSKLITYTLESEDGRSLFASGWTPVARSGGGDWSREGRTRAGRGKVAEYTGPKVRWEKILDPRRAKASPAIELPERGDPPKEGSPAEVEAVAASVGLVNEADAWGDLSEASQRLLGILGKAGEMTAEVFEGFGFVLKDVLPLEDRGLVKNLGVDGWVVTRQGIERAKILALL